VIVKPHVDWFALAPTLSLLGATAVLLMVAVFTRRTVRKLVSAFVGFAGFVAAFVFAIVVGVKSPHPEVLVHDAMYRDRWAALAQVLIAGSGAIAVLLSYRERWREEYVAEYYALLTAAAAGMVFFVQAANLMTLFLALEWFSISLYILCAIAIEEVASLEAGLKYLIVGSFGSAILLFGSAFVYGATGVIGFEDIAAASGDANQLFLVTGLAMIIVGLGFKASAAPFHMWTPDVYQGAPTPVTAFMSAATKVAALVLTMRLFVTAFPNEENLWTISLAVIVCISLAWGNLGALVQTDVKRMLAYSSISHAGFLLMPIAVGTPLGGRALMNYLISYAAMSIGSFAVVAARERELAQPVTLEGMSGMGWERPGLGAAMTLFMFGFIGLPPAGLFIGKFYAFSAAVDRGWAWLAVVGAIATVVSIKVLTPRQAVLLAAAFDLLGALAGTAVATTIGTGLVEMHFLTMKTILCGLLAGIVWNLLTWWLGLPSSSSHALVGGLCGAALASASGDKSVLKWTGLWQKVLVPMVTSPLCGFLFGFLLMGVLLVLLRHWRPRVVNELFGRLQLLSSAFMAFSHGMNDAQKTMGIIALALFTATTSGAMKDLPDWLGFLRTPNFHIATWIKIVCAITMSAGIAGGGWRIIRTIGQRVVKLQPIHGFAAQTASATVLLVAAQFGMPVSTTHAASTAIMGVGATKRFSALKWGIVGRIVWAWILTMPITFLLSYSSVVLLQAAGWV